MVYLLINPATYIKLQVCYRRKIRMGEDNPHTDRPGEVHDDSARAVLFLPGYHRGDVKLGEGSFFKVAHYRIAFLCLYIPRLAGGCLGFESPLGESLSYSVDASLIPPAYVRTAVCALFAVFQFSFRASCNRLL